MLIPSVLQSAISNISQAVETQFPPQGKLFTAVETQITLLKESGIKPHMHEGKKLDEMSAQEKNEWFASGVVELFEIRDWLGINRWCTMSTDYPIQ